MFFFVEKRQFLKTLITFRPLKNFYRSEAEIKTKEYLKNQQVFYRY